MVKYVDDIATETVPPLIDHVGWRLLRAGQLWERRFRGDMVKAGYAWFREARASVIPYLDRQGTRQADLVTRMGLSKQAVQQLVAALVDDGVLQRHPDPDDGRAHLVVFSASGLKMLTVANDVKLAIENDFRRALGDAEFSELTAALDRLLRSGV